MLVKVEKMVLKLSNGNKLVDQINNGIHNLLEMETLNSDPAINLHYFWLSKSKMLMMEDYLKLVVMKIKLCIGDWKDVNHDLLYKQIRYYNM